MSAKSNLTKMLLCATALQAVALGANAQVQDVLPTKEGVAEIFTTDHFSPYVGRNFPTRVLWGDTHLHTEVSVDAGTMNRVSQEDAYRFARGEQITTTHGLQARLGRPLDWLVIADHAEMYGLMPQLLAGDPEILARMMIAMQQVQLAHWVEGGMKRDPQAVIDDVELHIRRAFCVR